MKFDLTKEVALDEKNQKTYRIYQCAIYLISVLAGIYFSYLVLFPSRTFEFDFTSPNSSANSIINPRNEIGSPISSGKIAKYKDVYFDAALVGSFSTVGVNLTLNSKSANMESGTIEARRSYQAFLYPEGKPMGFKDGTLVKNNENYYLVSTGELRKFENLSAVNVFGFPKNAFVEASADELDYNALGQDIKTASGYPDSSLFKVNEDYYILAAQKLKKFAGAETFLNQYFPNQAISKNADFLAKYELAEDKIGFSDGTLISYGDGVYIVSGSNVFPIDNPVTFEALGYNWSSVIPASADEFSLYQKGKLVNIKASHPNGTIFSDAEKDKYYIIEDNFKHLLPSGNIANSWMKSDPIIASQKDLDILSQCEIKKRFLSARTLHCELPIESLANLRGKDYEFKQNVEQDVELDLLAVTFKKTASIPNLKSTLRDMLNRIIIRYVPQAAIQ
jgi:hypothetical protein